MNHEKSVLKQVRINMGCKKSEKILVLTDYLPLKNFVDNYQFDIILRSVFARDYYEILKKNGYKASFLAYPCNFQSGKEPPANIAKELLKHDVVIMLNSFSLSHTKTRKKASKKGVRIASIPGFEPEMYEDVMNADYKKIKKITLKVNKIINSSKKAIVTTKLGTRIMFELAKSKPDTGIYTKKGDFGNLPSGEIFLAPKTAEGILIVPKGWYKDLEKDMKFVVKKGYVTKIVGGGKVGEKLRKLVFAKKHLKTLIS